MDGRLSTALIALTDALGHASALPAIHEAALVAVQRATGIHRASIRLADADGTMRFQAWIGVSEAYRAALEGQTPWQPGEPTPPPLVTPDVRLDASLDRHQEAFAREAIASVAFVPIVSTGRVIGTLGLYRDVPSRFDAGELPAAIVIASQLGLAVERQRREAEFDIQHRRLLFSLDAAQMGTWDWNIATNQIRWSDNLERIHGLAPGSFTGEFASYEREIHPEDRERVFASLAHAVTTGAAHDIEYRIVAPDGTIRWMLGKGRIEGDAHGRPRAMNGICMDITARKDAELRASDLVALEAGARERLTRLAEGSQRLLTSLATDSVVDEVIALAQAVIAADAYALWRRIGDEWRITASRGVSADFSRTVLPADPRLLFEVPVIAEDVSAIRLLERRRPHYDDEGIRSLMSIPLIIQGEATGSLVFYYRTPCRPTDLELGVATALGHLAASAISNAALYAEQRRLRRDAEHAEIRAGFLADASVVLASLDYTGNLRRLAALAVPALGDFCAIDLLTDAGSIERLAVTHVDPASAELAREIARRFPERVDDQIGIAHVLRTGEPGVAAEVTDEHLVAVARDPAHLDLMRRIGIRSVMIVPLSAGRQVFGAITLAISAGSRRYTTADLAFATELARRAALAIENARLYEQAQSANRLKDEFLATLSHELRTPLNVILGRTRMLRGMGAIPVKAVEIVERNAEMLHRLVEDLLDISRISIGQVILSIQPVNLGAIAQAVAASLEPMAQSKGIHVEVACVAQPPALLADPMRLHQVVWNLLTNAVKFTPDGGSVAVDVDDTPAHARLVVTDSGEGIAREFLPHVFDMFRQAEPANTRRYGGLGLGLSIVRRLVELHGGTVHAHSDGEGRGATFTVRLPHRPPRPPSSADPIAPTAA